jgi:hypothetical protein
LVEGEHKMRRFGHSTIHSLFILNSRPQWPVRVIWIKLLEKVLEFNQKALLTSVWGDSRFSISTIPVKRNFGDLSESRKQRVVQLSLSKTWGTLSFWASSVQLVTVFRFEPLHTAKITGYGAGSSSL